MPDTLPALQPVQQTIPNPVGAIPNPVGELDLLTQQITASTMPEDLKDRCLKLLIRIKSLRDSNITSGQYSLQEYEITKKYLDWILTLPFGRYTQDNLDLNNAKQVLDAQHFGLEQIKETILEFLSTKILKQKISAGQMQPTTIPNGLNYQTSALPVLCFVGVQGIGKTTMARSIAMSLGREFVSISLSSFASVHELRGRNKAEPGAEPGQITKALMKAKTMNPVILLDEVDKVSSDTGLKADIMAALLEILDPEQNKQFNDRYIDYPVDLSQVIFITTANNLSGISAALLDRLEVVRFNSYTDQEKMVIGKTYLLPKVLKANGITLEQLDIAEDAWPLIVRPLGFDPGIRQLERNITLLARKVAKMVVEGQQGKVSITAANFREFFPERIEVRS